MNTRHLLPRRSANRFAPRSLAWLVLLLMALPLLAAAQCPSDNIILSTQAQADAFPPGCTNVPSSLIVSGADITNLNGLKNVQSVRYDLRLGNNPQLTSLAGLTSLTSVGNSLQINNDALLANVDGLNRLQSVGIDLQLTNNPQLTSLAGLTSLTSVGNSLRIDNDALLANLNGLNNLQSVGGDLRLESDPQLTSLAGLTSLTRVGGSLQIDTDALLPTLDGLNKLQSVGNDLTIKGNPQLTSLQGLNNLASVKDYLLFQNNIRLSQCAIASICAVLATNITTYISGNASGCNSAQDIQADCTPLAITTQPPAGSTVCPGSTVTATVSTTGNARAYQWYKGNQAVSGQTSATLTLTNVQPADAGTYVVVVSNSVSSLTSTAFNLTVTPQSPDYQALVDLYNATGGPNWTNKTNWLTGCTPCGWYGVACVNGRVTSLILSSNKLVGSLPASLSALTSLQYLYLSNNQLSGSIPASLSALTNLQLLDLSNNQLSGSIPASLSALTSLRVLDLSNNQLSGSIPASLSALTSLRYLYLNNNQLSGCFPASLSALCGKTVDFSSNPGLPGGGDFGAFCNNGVGSDAFRPLATASPNPVCAGSPVSLSVTAGTFYQWSGPASFSATTQTPTFTPATAASSGLYSVTVGNGSPTCTATASVSLTVNPLPTVSIVGLPASICQEAAPVLLTGLGNPAGGTFTIDGTPATIFTPASLSVGQHTVVYAYTNASGCSNTTSQTVTIKATPQTPTIATQSGHPYPAGVSSLTASQNTGDVVLTASGCAGGTITWAGEASNTLSVSTVNTGVQTFTATCSQNGCTSPVSTATVTVVAPTLTVSHQDATFGQLVTNTIKPYLLLSDVGTNPIPYSQITVRYWLTVEGNSPITNFQNNYVQLGANNVHERYVALAQPRQGATAYVEYSFDAAAGVLGATSNSGPIQNQFGKADFSGFNQADDYSFVANRDYVLNPRITAYINGQLVYGQEPAVPGSGPSTPLSASLTATATVFPTTDNTTLVAQAAGGSGTYSYQFSGPGTLSPNGNTAVASGLSAGVQTFTVTVADTSTPSPQLATATVSVTVTGPPNTAPVASANTNQTATVGLGFNYQVQAFSDAQTPNSLTYSATINPANGLVFNPATRVISGTPSQTGVSTVMVTATDPGGLSASTSFSVTVRPAPNTAPVSIPNANQTARVGVGFTYTVNAFTDTETPGNLTYSVMISPANGLSFDPTTRLISGTPSQTGVTTVTVTATDPESLSDSTSFTITVNPAPVGSSVQLSVLHQDATFGQFNTNTIKPFLELVNSGATAIPYSAIKIRYYLTVEGGSAITNFQNYYVQLGANNVHTRFVRLASPVSGANGYVEYSFDAAAGSLAPGANSGPIQNGFTKDDYSGFNQSDDYSYALNRDYAVNSRITAYVNNVLVFGTPPPAGAPARIGVEESLLSVQVLGNPVVTGSVEVTVSGAEGRSLRYELTDVSGYVVSEQRVEQAGVVDYQSLRLTGQSAGILLLRVSSPTQSQTVKILKQ